MKDKPKIGQVFQCKKVKDNPQFEFIIAVSPTKTYPNIILHRLYQGYAETATQVQIVENFLEKDSFYIDGRDDPSITTIKETDLIQMGFEYVREIYLSPEVQNDVETILDDQYPYLL